MNEYLLLTLLERLLSIYNNSEISLDKQCQFTQEFKAPIAASYPLHQVLAHYT